MDDPSSSTSQSLNRTLDGTITSAPKGKAVYLLHSNVKIFASAIAALSKLGDEIYLQPQERGLRLKAFNKNRSAYGVFLFMDDFFTDFDTKFVKGGVRDCRISTKAIVTFARQNFCDVSLFFDRAGSPIIVAVESDAGFSAEFIIATLDGEDQRDEDAFPEVTQEIKKAKLSNEGADSTPSHSRPNSMDEDTGVPYGNNEELQRNSSEEELAEMLKPTQPSGNPLMSDTPMESDDQNLDRLSLDDNDLEEPNPDDQALADINPIDGFEQELPCAGTIVEPANEAKTSEQGDVRANVHNTPEVNVKVGLDRFM
ncbi:unnamed protein product [Strongylus vulgaris]|uniref:Uncharacterized protein n=1 Tax=Strongylus vulgaris TaxID=40348 RepID=A0A3P7JBI7_STRVU|nr:unnamed protein product [Strongylus vulgaris]